MCSLRKFKKKYFIYLFLQRRGEREKEKERNINVWLPVTDLQLGTWPATQACSLIGNWTGDPLVHRPSTQLAEPHQPGQKVLCIFPEEVAWALLLRGEDKHQKRGGYGVCKSEGNSPNQKKLYLRIHVYIKEKRS